MEYVHELLGRDVVLEGQTCRVVDQARSFRLLTVIDEYTRKCLANDVDRRLNSDRVLERLTDLFTRHGPPDYLVRTLASATITGPSLRRKPYANAFPN